MTLDRDQADHILLYLRNRGVEPRCPFCGSQRWLAGGLAIAPFVDLEGNIEDEGWPLAQLICLNCSYVATFSANHVGLFPTPPPNFPTPCSARLQEALRRPQSARRSGVGYGLGCSGGERKGTAVQDMGTGLCGH